MVVGAFLSGSPGSVRKTLRRASRIEEAQEETGAEVEEAEAEVLAEVRAIATRLNELERRLARSRTQLGASWPATVATGSTRSTPLLVCVMPLAFSATSRRNVQFLVAYCFAERLQRRDGRERCEAAHR